MYDLNGEIAVVTGGGGGIGRAIALRLAREGCAIGLLDRDGPGMETTMTQIRDAGGTAAASVGSVARREDVARGLAELAAALGPATILVNNAGILRTAPFLGLSQAAWHDTIGVNLDGVFHCSQVALPAMVERGSGVIINIASFAGKKGLANHAAYSASKFGVIGLTQCMAEEMAERGIRINAVCPGIIVDTGMREVAEAEAKAQGRPPVDVRVRAAPMRRVGMPDEIAQVVAFLASGEASYMTGQAINVTGGLWMN